MTAVLATDRVADMAASPPYPSFAEATQVFLKIGVLSFGGPAGQIALMHRLLVEEKRWISEARFLHALNYCMLLPGPEAQQLATYVGWLLHGTRGGLVAGTLFILPGFAVILTLASLYGLYQGTDLLASLFFGLKAAVLVIVVEALLRVAKRALKNRTSLAIAGAAFVAIFVFGLPFPLIVLAAALTGFFGARFKADLFLPGRKAAEASESHGYLTLPDPEVSRGPGRAFRLLLLWGAILVAPLLPLMAVFGPESVYLPIAVFFSKMAVVTFGGAYAVLAYVAQEAVGSLGWLVPGEMLDGLAMAETTPGPLILVLTYVGFLAAFRAPQFLDPWTAGLLGALLTTWVTFVPCFLWIFLGAPYVERLRANRALSGALSAITAAVVGVILNLALWFGLNVLFAEVGRLSFGWISLSWPAFGSLDLEAALLTLAAGIALLRFKLGMIPVLFGTALAGLLLRFFLA